MKIKVKESFEYEVEVPDGLPDSVVLKYVWRIRDTLDYINDHDDLYTAIGRDFSKSNFIFDELTWEKI